MWVDGSPRVSCVTPAARVQGRRVTTIEGLGDALEWAQRFAECGASQCGFCTPGIIMRLAALPRRDLADSSTVRRSLLAHLCRCTGWQPIIDAAAAVGLAAVGSPESDPSTGRGTGPAADRRAQIEGRSAQRVGVETALGGGGFADDDHPTESLVAMRGTDGKWAVADSVAAARRAIGKVQGRRTTTEIDWPVDLPVGDFDRTLQTTWIEPGYLEPDASWCRPGEPPANPLGNGGAFGAKLASPVTAVAAELGARHRAVVRAMYSREDVVIYGPKRPPVAIAMDRDGSGVVRVATTGGPLLGAEAIEERWPRLAFEYVQVAGPAVSLDLRAAVDAELLAVVASFQPGPEFVVTTDDGATAAAVVGEDQIAVRVECGEPLDAAVLRSYCTGAAHMAFGMVTSEAIRLGPDGRPADLTIRSFGIVRAVDIPPIRVEIAPSTKPPVNGSDAVFAAVAAATWSTRHWAPRWPTGSS